MMDNKEMWDYIAQNIELIRNLDRWEHANVLVNHLKLNNIDLSGVNFGELYKIIDDIKIGLIDVRALRFSPIYDSYPQLSGAEAQHKQFYFKENRVQYKVADKTTHPILLGQLSTWMKKRLIGYKESNPHLYTRNYMTDWNGEWMPYVVVLDTDPHYSYIIEIGRDKNLMNCYYDLETGALLERGADASNTPYTPMASW